MKHGLRGTSITLVSLIASLFITLPALAVPPLPSSFYGTVKVNTANVPDGTSVQALISGKVFAETVTQTYQGDSVYALNVPGDDTDSTVVDGGREGDTIMFKIGGVLAVQTEVWHSGTNANLDLTVSTSTPVATPKATLTPLPTQTAIPTQKPSTVPPTPLPAIPTVTTPVESSPAPAISNQVSSTPTSPDQPSLIATQALQPSLMSTEAMQPSPTSTSPENKPLKSSGSITTTAVVVMVTLVVVMIIGYIIMAFREKKM